jgi:predicted nucleic acid-binding protein
LRVVLDADILSTFSRISRPDILNALFDEVLVPGSVVSEVRRAKIDTSAVKHVVPRLTRQELLELRLLDPRLGKGERECVAIAKHRNILLARSDRVVQAVCRIEGIDFLNLPRLLRFALIEGVIGREGVRELIRLIEFEENTTINGKDEIFR